MSFGEAACQNCGETFEKVRKGQRFCCVACRVAAHEKAKVHVCGRCGEPVKCLGKRSLRVSTAPPDQVGPSTQPA